MPNKRLRTLIALLSVCVMSLSMADARDLTFEERVAAQEAIDRVYYSHQIGVTRSFEEALPRVALQRKVTTYLEQSAALELFWNTPVTAKMLQRELERMADETLMPDRLLELFEALDNDPFLIQECLARPALADRLARNFYDFDSRFHAAEESEADQLRRALASGSIDPWLKHPHRTEVEQLREEMPAVPNEVPAVEESREAFYIRVVLEEDESEMRLATYSVEKTPWHEWWESVSPDLKAASVNAVARPDIAIPAELGQPDRAFDPESLNGEGEREPCVTDDTWENGSLDKLPEARQYHSAVWTGSLMIVWGGYQSFYAGGSSYLDSGGRYDPATDSWTPTSTAGAPSGRRRHTAVWTGNRMVVWGGYGGSYFNSGGQYDPLTDSWTPTSTVDAPSARYFFLADAVWTGSEMLIWGGFDGSALGTGGRYDPETDSWTAISTIGAPSARYYHRAVWSGSEMLVWGGNGGGSYLGDGGRYDPETDSWSAISTTGAPSGRYRHAAVWTGSLMVVWGGYGPHWTANGGRYDPVTDSWTPISAANTPTARADRVVWTGSEMIVWGGNWNTSTTWYHTGGRYDPVADSWTDTSIDYSPRGREHYEAVWTGSLMILWGGSAGNELDTGARYDPVTDSWTPTSTMGGPGARRGHKAVWTGNLMLVWGGRGVAYNTPRSGGMYDPAIDTWTSFSQSSFRSDHSVVWTGDELIAWGGGYTESGDQAYEYWFNTGWRYDPVTRTNEAISTEGAPSPRKNHTAVWTGNEMVVWGGDTEWDGRVYDGGRYDPATDSWEPVSTAGVPSARSGHTAVWTGNRMVVWGGNSGLNSGGRYNPTTDSWSSTSTAGAPSARYEHKSVWTGSRMLVWGGSDGGYLDSGGQYDPVADSWAATTTVGAPNGRTGFSAVWTDDEMIVWGGTDGDRLNTGGRYNPVSDSWVSTSTAGAPASRSEHTAVWTGSWMVVWGGSHDALLNTGGRYALGHSIDNDSDGYTECDGDCNDDHYAVYFGAPEINDGVDNQCPGEWGSGMRDEIAGVSGFHNSDLKIEFSWDPQPGATSYQLVSCMTPDFTGFCYSWILSGTSYVDGGSPGPGGLFYYLVRAFEPYAGSWGTDSEGQERDVYP